MELGLGGYGSEEEEQHHRQQLLSAGGLLGYVGVSEVLSEAAAEIDADTAMPRQTATSAVQVPNAAPDLPEPEPDVLGRADDVTPSPEETPMRSQGSEDETGTDALASLPAELYSPPPGRCPASVEDRLHAIRRTAATRNISFIASLRANAVYSNPDVLQQLVKANMLKEWGSAFPTGVFDPESLLKEDYADSLMREYERTQEQRKRERATGTGAVPFTSAGTLQAPPVPAGLQAPPGLPSSASNPSMHGAAAAAAATAAKLAANPQLAQQMAANEVAARKRSKWDSGR
mmetsp:Transcript_4240/g.7008  ORF Transcript_4240/g.7008 Transcript_4240/m.7008 type:complete len:289 (-) Transcript_4240:525-1391(-)